LSTKFGKRVSGGLQIKPIKDGLRESLFCLDIYVKNEKYKALIDCGCNVSFVSKYASRQFLTKYHPCRLTFIDGSSINCNEYACIKNVVGENDLKFNDLKCFVLEKMPFSFDFIFGLDVILEHNLITVHKNVKLLGMNEKMSGVVQKSDVNEKIRIDVAKMNEKMSGVAQKFESNEKIVIDDVDFTASWNEKEWNVKWKWKENQETIKDCMNPRQIVNKNDKDRFDNEIQLWIDEGILIPYNETKHEKVKRYIPLMSVRQEKGESVKIRPVLDYRELNKLIESHPAGAVPLCSERLRSWRQVGTTTSVLDLRKAYLQIKVDKNLWTYQAVKWKGKTFLLTRLGFGLCSAPKIMTKIVEFVISQNKNVQQGVSSYIDDLFVNERIIKAKDVSQHFEKWGLKTKDPEFIGNEQPVRVLGLKIDKDFKWSREKVLPKVNENNLTRRELHKYIGELLGHFPVCGKLRIMCAMLQRLSALESDNWDKMISNELMSRVSLTQKYVNENGDPCRGDWLVDRKLPLTVWTDASSIALGVVLEVNGKIVEDGGWLRPKNDVTHINRAELDAAIKGINLAVKWGKRSLILKVDSKTVYGWLNSVINKTHNVKTHSLAEIVIRRRLEQVKEIIEIEKLQIAIELVPSSNNKADNLTRLPSHWKIKPTNEDLSDQVKAIHNQSHLGVEKTFQLCRERHGDKINREFVKKFVQNCEQCCRIDPSVTFKWERGKLSSGEIWERLAVDITHVNGHPYLSVIDDHSRFTIWRQLKNESFIEVCRNLRQIISEYGPPKSIMSDNGTVFRCKEMKELLKNWEIEQQFSAAYRPQGNGLVERVHRTIKRSVGRTKRSVEEAVFWYNNTSGVHKSTPFEILFGYSSRKPGVNTDRTRCADRNIEVEAENNYADKEKNPFIVGDKVYLKPKSRKCNIEWSGPHRITKIHSNVSVEIDGDDISRHVSFLRLAPRQKINEFNDDCKYEEYSEEYDCDSENESKRENQIKRERRPPAWHKDYVLY